MENIIEEITKLTDEWYKLIGPQHHKDRCCHWYIETKWSYGHPPTYQVQHYGYILDDIIIECATYEMALQALKTRLGIEIAQYKFHQTDTLDLDE